MSRLMFFLTVLMLLHVSLILGAVGEEPTDPADTLESSLMQMPDHALARVVRALPGASITSVQVQHRDSTQLYRMELLQRGVRMRAHVDEEGDILRLQVYPPDQAEQIIPPPQQHRPNMEGGGHFPPKSPPPHMLDGNMQLPPPPMRDGDRPFPPPFPPPHMLSGEMPFPPPFPPPCPPCHRRGQDRPPFPPHQERMIERSMPPPPPPRQDQDD